MTGGTIKAQTTFLYSGCRSRHRKRKKERKKEGKRKKVGGGGGGGKATKEEEKKRVGLGGPVAPSGVGKIQ